MKPKGGSLRIPVCNFQSAARNTHTRMLIHKIDQCLKGIRSNDRVGIQE